VMMKVQLKYMSFRSLAIAFMTSLCN
jgi:hypothetical protein